MATPDPLLEHIKRIWKDPVWSNLIAGALTALAVWAYTAFSDNATEFKQAESTRAIGAADSPPKIATPISHVPPLTPDLIKNGTYQFGKEWVTLVDGQREFNETTAPNSPPRGFLAYIRESAFGDVDGDGDIDAVVVLELNEGGTGKYSSLFVVINDDGTPRVANEGYTIGDRINYAGIRITPVSIDVDAAFHSQNDALCCPSERRIIKFFWEKSTLQCLTAPCSEVPEQ